MKYTKYFAQLIRSQGIPQLPDDHYRTFLNILHQEAKLKVYKGNNTGHRYTRRIYTITKIIEELTGKLEPKELVQKWVSGERIPKNLIQEENAPWDEHEPYLVQKPREDFKSRSRKY